MQVTFIVPMHLIPAYFQDRNTATTYIFGRLRHSYLYLNTIDYYSQIQAIAYERVRVIILLLLLDFYFIYAASHLQMMKDEHFMTLNYIYINARPSENF